MAKFETRTIRLPSETDLLAAGREGWQVVSAAWTSVEGRPEIAAVLMQRRVAADGADDSSVGNAFST